LGNMSNSIKTISSHGSDGALVEIECSLTNSLPNIVIVGLAQKSVDEAKERVRSAFGSSQLQFPRKRIIINLAPADTPKDGASLDLAIALSILAESGLVNTKKLASCLVFGELGLDGSIRPVRGIIGKLLIGRKLGHRRCILPADNAPQAYLVPDLHIASFNTLKELYTALTNPQDIPFTKTTNADFEINNAESHDSSHALDMAEVIGQARAKRALEIAASGGHNILLAGAPGTGKSMLAKVLPGILPSLSKEQILEITQLHSLASRDFDRIIVSRPFRAPHHSSSHTAIVGGGQQPKPGEVSLAHHGVLFLDELPEFSRTTLEALRQPLEDRKVTVSRAKESVTYPANFMLVATANPCPCGYYGTSKPCVCTASQIARYQQKLSGPILDRIDIYVEVEDVEHRKLLSKTHSGENSAIQQRVKQARLKQRNRGVQLTNASMSNAQIKKYCTLTTEAEELLNQAAERLLISARSYMKIIKVARTIADLDTSEIIDTQHIAEALQYRRNEEKHML
jgi:magnesium chelatase family protein